MSSITTAEFAAALETDTRTARKFLRSITPKDEQPGKGSRWAIDGTKRSLNTMKKNFNTWSAAQAKEAADRAAKKAEEAAAAVTEVEDTELDD